MRIINLEDDPLKHAAIDRTVKSAGDHELVWARDFTDGIEKIKAASKSGACFDLVITDMYFPLTAGGREVSDAGEQLIDALEAEALAIPVIVCSSVNLFLPKAFGCVWYSQLRDWEDDLLQLLNRRNAELL